jgi:hypothetical protein
MIEWSHIEWSHTEGRFCRGEFQDRDGAECSIQTSSLPIEDCIWLGRAPIRMHLTREMAGELAQILLKFSYTGELP